MEDLDDSNINSTGTNSVFESPAGDRYEYLNVNSSAVMDTKSSDNKPVFEMRNFAAEYICSSLGSEGRRLESEGRISLGSEGRRLESEEFENISVSGVEDMKPDTKGSIRKLHEVESEKDKLCESGVEETKTLGGRSSDGSLHVNTTNDKELINAVNNHEGMKGNRVTGGILSHGVHHSLDDILEDTDETGGLMDEHPSETGDTSVKTGDTSMRSSDLEHGTDLEHGDYAESEVAGYESRPNKSVKREAGNHHTPHLDDSWDENCNKFRKHSSGDLHSRLKTRKLLGVGETDDGDVHRSKLSQILGHSDQLYIRLPNGLRVWQIVLSAIFSVLSIWALLFPSNYFMIMYDMDGTNITFPIRLYACALICISVMYWSTIQAADRDVIRMVLLSSVVFFILQTCVVAGGMMVSVLSFSRWTIFLLGMQCMSIMIGYYFYCGIVGPRTGAIKRTTSSKDLSEKDQ